MQGFEGRYKLLEGSCLDQMKRLPDNSVDSIVTDPPYELGFMGKKWDSTGIAYNVEVWKEALRVLKPGGHLLAFSGSRTYHRMTCAIEDAGFEVRDQIMWVYGSGFPKSLDVSKAIDKAAGVVREVIGARKSEGGRTSQANTEGIDPKALIDITAPATDAARQWEGWGTALKPAHEPICVARKPLIGTVAANVLAHGTGAMNIEACRVEGAVTTNPKTRGVDNISTSGHVGQADTGLDRVSDIGRWPANLIHDGSDEVLAGFPITSSGAMKREVGGYEGDSNTGFIRGRSGPSNQHGDSGSAARFFYCAKATNKDRGEGNSHPTVKPTGLMRYLVRLVTPNGGIVLDIFNGSGSTGKASMLEGMRYIGIDLSEDYLIITDTRMKSAIKQADFPQPPTKTPKKPEPAKQVVQVVNLFE